MFTFQTTVHSNYMWIYFHFLFIFQLKFCASELMQDDGNKSCLCRTPRNVYICLLMLLYELFCMLRVLLVALMYPVRTASNMTVSYNSLFLLGL
jgi:hypothetical protein